MRYDASSVVHFRSSSRPAPATSHGDVSMTLTTTTHSPQQLMAVWNPRLNGDSEGSTLISDTAIRICRISFYISSLDSYSRTHGGVRRAAPSCPARCSRHRSSAAGGARRTSGWGVAAGEHAGPVAGLGGPPQVRWHHAVAAGQVEGLALGAEPDAGDLAVAGQPAGAGGGDPRAESGGGRCGAGVGVGEVVEVDGDQHVRLDGAQDR